MIFRHEQKIISHWKNGKARGWQKVTHRPCLFQQKKKPISKIFKLELYDKVKGIHSQRFPYNDYLYNSDWTKGIQE